MKILVTEPRIYSKVVLDQIKDHDITQINILEDNIAEFPKDTEAILSGLDTILMKEQLDLFPELKYIVCPTTGLNHMDTKHCEERNIKLLSLKGEFEFLSTITPTAEMAFGLLLAVSRKIFSAHNAVVHEHTWKREQFVGNCLFGKKLGTLGFGRLGKIMCKIGKAFSMKTIAYDPNPARVEEMKENDVPSVEWEKVLQESDIIFVNINLTDDNHHIISTKEFNLMKDSAFFINTSRGQLVDEDALLSALENKKIKGAGLDVLGTELDEGHPGINKLVQYAKNNDNIVITPHIGGSAYEAFDRVSSFVVQKLVTETKN